MGFDLNRIVVAGGSQGGALALAIAGLKPNIIKACIADVPIYCDMFQHQLMAPQIDPEKPLSSNMCNNTWPKLELHLP